ncbi:hypothetical protein AB0N81_36505 [Streptomyces sp. NPDC093510]
MGAALTDWGVRATADVPAARLAGMALRRGVSASGDWLVWWVRR